MTIFNWRMMVLTLIGLCCAAVWGAAACRRFRAAGACSRRRRRDPRTASARLQLFKDAPASRREEKRWQATALQSGFAAVLALALLLALPAALAAGEAAGTTAQTESPQQSIELGNLFEEAEQALKRIDELQERAQASAEAPPDLKALAETKKQAAAEIERRVRRNSLTLREIDLELQETEKETLASDLRLKTISDAITQLQVDQTGLADLKKKWTAAQDAYQDSGLKDLQNKIKEVLKKTDDASANLTKITDQFLKLQVKCTEARTILADHGDWLEDRRAELAGSLWTKDSPSILDPAFYLPQTESASTTEPAPGATTPVEMAMPEAGLGPNLKKSFAAAADYLRSEKERAVIHLALLLALWLWLRKSLGRARAKASELPRADELSALLEHPLAIAMILASLPAPLLHPEAPQEIKTLAQLILVLPVALVLVRLLGGPAKRFIVIMACCNIIGVVHELIFELPPFDRVLIIAQAGLGLAAAVWLIALTRSKLAAELHLSKWWTRAFRLGLAVMIGVLAVVLYGQASGLNRASVYLAQNAFNSIDLILFGFATYPLLRSLVAYVLFVDPLQRARVVVKYRLAIVDRAGKVMMAGVGLGATGALLVLWDRDQAVLRVLGRVFGWGPAVGEGKLTLGEAGLAAGALYLSIILSRFLAAVLDEEVYPRRDLHPGLQSAINQVIRYALVFIGFVAALAVLGVRFQSIAIIAGALGVGIGFGLQGIVNNFVSGLIILVERPIKVGDVLELDGRWAVVKSIGIRSTLIQTWDQAEIIVPNGDLLGGKIVNWSHTNLENQILLKVGVAYSSNPRQVLDLLLQILNDHPDIMKTPPPSVVLAGFGDSTLDFELRARIPDLDRRLAVASQLRLAILETFAQHHIQLPFPSRDLWIRSSNQPAPPGQKPA